MTRSISVRMLTMALAGAMVSAAPVFAEQTDERASRLGSFVLDVMSGDEEQESRAKRILRRAAEVFTEIAVPEEDPQDNHAKMHEGHPGKGPPDWAPAHGWRRNFGEEETNNLGSFTRDRIEEGLSGAELMQAVRGEIDRVLKSATAASGDDDDGSDKKNDDKGGKPDNAGKGNANKGKSGGKH